MGVHTEIVHCREKVVVLLDVRVVAGLAVTFPSKITIKRRWRYGAYVSTSGVYN